MIGLFKNMHWHASSEIELAEIKRFYGKKSIVEVIPNLPVFSNHQPETKKNNPKDSLNLLSNRISPIKNVVFLLKVLEKIEFNIVLNLIGPLEDEKYWNQCEKIIDNLPDNCSVNYLNEKRPRID